MEKREEVQKCFYCPNKAIAVATSCSPTSSTGTTSEKPLCGDCIVIARGGIGINIVRLLVPQEEFDKAVKTAKEKINRHHPLDDRRGVGEIYPWDPSSSSKLVPLSKKTK